MTDPGQQADDPDELRASQRESWERAAAGWDAGNDRFQVATMPVTRWLVEAIRPQPGMTVLELAAGIGEVGFHAAELIAPGGKLITTDGSEPMLERAKARAEQRGVRDVEFKPVELEWIDLVTASVDAVICRWGYMFALDREAALRETRRVLRPGGRVAFATWTAGERNPWGTIPRAALYDAGLVDELRPPGPGPFDLADPALLQTLLDDAGFFDATIEEVEVVFPYEDLDAYLAQTQRMSPSFATLAHVLDGRQLDDLRERLGAGAAPFIAPDGSLALPGVALLVAADA